MFNTQKQIFLKPLCPIYSLYDSKFYANRCNRGRYFASKHRQPLTLSSECRYLLFSKETAALKKLGLCVALYHCHDAKIVVYSAIIAPLDGFEYRYVPVIVRRKSNVWVNSFRTLRWNRRFRIGLTSRVCQYFNDPESRTR